MPRAWRPTSRLVSDLANAMLRHSCSCRGASRLASGVCAARTSARVDQAACPPPPTSSRRRPGPKSRGRGGDVSGERDARLQRRCVTAHCSPVATCSVPRPLSGDVRVSGGVAAHAGCCASEKCTIATSPTNVIAAEAAIHVTSQRNRRVGLKGRARYCFFFFDWPSLMACSRSSRSSQPAGQSFSRMARCSRAFSMRLVST